MTKNSKKLRNILEEALSNFDKIQKVVREERLQCLKDRRFYSIAGAQWEGALDKQFEQKPKFEVNKIHLAVIRVINEYRNNRVTVNFVPKDGDPKDELSDLCAGLFRADEQDSTAEEAYDNAFEEAVGGGFGAIRLRSVYEDEYDIENEHQRIRIEPIFDADSSVFFDLDAKRQDKSDAKYCFVITGMTHDTFKKNYDLDPVSVSKDIHQTEYDWCTSDVVYVAEYYKVEEKSTNYVFFEDDLGEERRYEEEEANDDKVLKELKYGGFSKTRNRKMKKKRIHKYIISGNDVLEDCGYLAGKNIPIVPSYGKRWYVDNVERCMGHVRLAKDAQRLKNMQLSRLGEISVLSPIRKPIFTPEQMGPHGTMWSEDNIKNYPYLFVDPITDKEGNSIPQGPVGYTEPPDIPPALSSLLQITDLDIEALLGNQGEADKMMSNVSGKAVEMIQTRKDMQSYIYMSNFSKSVRRVGEVWLSMAKELYVELGRKMKIVGESGDIGSEELGENTLDPVSHERYSKNDISKAALDVDVTVGPSSSSRRESTVRVLMGMMQIAGGDQQTMKVLQSMAMMNMDGEGIADARSYFRKQLVQMGVIEPTKEEAEAMKNNSGPSPQDQLMSAMADEASSKAAKAKAEVQSTVADTSLKQAKTAEIIAGLDNPAGLGQ